MKNYLNEIATDKLEIQNSLIGLGISNAKKLLGYWWILDSYSLNNQGGYTYWLARSGKGKIRLDTDIHNIVIDVEPLIITTNEFMDWKS
jgi:hypothetical protein